MDAMPRPRPPYLHRYVTRHGRVIWYVRKPGGKRVRIRAEYGSPEFDTAYQAAIAGEPIQSPPKASTGSLEWLWDRYRETNAWAVLSPATRRQRENIMAGVLKTNAATPYAALTKAAIGAGCMRRTPSQGINFLKLMRGLFKWAAQAGHVDSDPTHDVPPPKPPKTEGFVVWSEDDVDAYHLHWPLGTRQRVWFDVLLYTGLRRGDAVKLGRQHVRDGYATIRTEKSGHTTEVTLRILPALAATIAAGPCGDLAYICGANGRPLTKESFGNLFKDACVQAGITRRKQAAHGLRKIGSVRAADNGATTHELMALFGWKTVAQAELYTRAANRKKLAKEAIGKMQRSADPMCSPASKVSTGTE